MLPLMAQEFKISIINILKKKGAYLYIIKTSEEASRNIGMGNLITETYRLNKQ